MNMENEDLQALKEIMEERKNRKGGSTTCEFCGLTYPKGGWTYYKIKVKNMSIEKLVDNIEKGITPKEYEFEEHIICSDCHEHLKPCEEC